MQTKAAGDVLERLEMKVTRPEDVAGITFHELGIGDNLVRALRELGAEHPFAIQAATIPDIIAGHHVLGRAHTGSGKTVAFGVGAVERFLKLRASGRFGSDPKRAGVSHLRRGRARGGADARKPKAVVLAPTRELALQIDRTVQPLARAVGLYTTQLVGGLPMEHQMTALRRGVDIVIGTPGRMEDLIDRRELDLSDVAIAVIDEADHMCELGFLEPVQRLLRRTKPGAQMLLFSATLDRHVAELIAEFLPQHRAHDIVVEETAARRINHRVMRVPHGEKGRAIIELARQAQKVLVFTRTRVFAETLAEQLKASGIKAVPLHGDLAQSKRLRHLQQLTRGEVHVLVATDVAARGIHVDDIDLVVQADPPGDEKTYLHRAGRTGRAGAHGTSVTLVSAKGERRMRELLENLGVDVASPSE